MQIGTIGLKIGQRHYSAFPNWFIFENRMKIRVSASINVWWERIYGVVFTCKLADHRLHSSLNYKSINHMRTDPMQIIIFQKKKFIAPPFKFAKRVHN